MPRPFAAAGQFAVRATAAAVLFLSLSLSASAPVRAQSVGAAPSTEGAPPPRTAAAPPPLRRGSGLPLPRFAALRSDETNVRAGPGSRYPIDWVFKRKSMPVEIVAEFENYRKIRDWQGAGGWVHQSLLVGKRHVLVTTRDAALRKTPSKTAPELAKLQSEVVAQVKSCGGEWCRVQVGPHVGWVERTQVWGVYKGENVN
ncbi:MAG: hypothetical protein IPK81_13065 [Rhodospirillales bacterium]|nr:MAG: hypothetical protein IPK81_13065 [Rhodospirillales bacterium]